MNINFLRNSSMKEIIAFLLIALASNISQAASFDCGKASNDAEKTICQDSTIGNLDEILSDNYNAMLAADIGDDAKKDLKSTQKKWLSDRNKCTNDKKCLDAIYKERIDKVCEYPALSGIHPTCKSYNENGTNDQTISTQTGWHKVTAKPNLVVRSAPDVSSEKLGNIPLDGKVNVLEYTDKKDFIGGYEGTWVKIQWKDGVGYSFSAFMKYLENQSANLDNINEISESPDSTNSKSDTTLADAKAQQLPEDAKNILSQLFVGESLFDKGKYSQIQIEALFDQHVKDKEVLVSGEITNIGKSFSGDKYITIKVKDNHFFDVYPATDFNVLDYNKGQSASFVGRWTKVGTGMMISHVLKNAIKIN